MPNRRSYTPATTAPRLATTPIGTPTWARIRHDRRCRVNLTLFKHVHSRQFCVADAHLPRKAHAVQIGGSLSRWQVPGRPLVRPLAARAHGNIKGGSAVIEQALEGMLLGEHHPVLIRLHMDHITLLDRLAAGIDDEIEAALDAVPAAWGVAADGVPSPGPGTGCRGAARSGAARGDSWRQPQARPGNHRRVG